MHFPLKKWYCFRLIFEITLVKELLIINSSYYNNTLNKNKTMYYHQISRMIYHYFSDNTFILSDISNNLNILNPEDELSITQKQVELYILDPLNSFDKYPVIFPSKILFSKFSSVFERGYATFIYSFVNPVM